ncbi:hypothetical protein H8K90_02870 [Winogradskyella echinorum]|uniref:Lipoprotein n=1 Tax=Winogradskyella echinorum TaxID=538189 RepID=A0ABR6XXU4_9FLAO|nr:hypothetical protein [Winogradskyella echinorum]MBC3845311.1 hypothetical protein [Winogradskyella echinorum]MBC5749659.1 hypothetical protein [Winogradskyella echinorum]
MKNVRLIFVLLLVVNCTPDTSDVDTLDTSNIQPEVQNCIDDLPKVRLTNNGTRSFEFIVYGHDYSTLHTQNLTASSDSGWVELPNNDVIIVATNNIDYGQKIPINLVLCDNIEFEIDTNNVLILSD